MSTRPNSRFLNRLYEQRTNHRRRGRVYRFGFATLGGLITLIGLALLVLPGPAFVVLPVGLFMLALEFNWAERLLEWAVRRSQAVSSSARRLPAEFLVTFILLVIGTTIAGLIWILAK